MVRLPALALSLLAALPVTAQAGSVEERFAEAISVCLADFPDLSGVPAAAMAAGFVPEGSADGATYFSSYGRSMILGLAPQIPACVVAMDGVTDGEAVAVVQSVLAASPALAPEPLVSGVQGLFLAGWEVSTPGGRAGLGVGYSTQLMPGFTTSPVMIRPFNR